MNTLVYTLGLKEFIPLTGQTFIHTADVNQTAKTVESTKADVYQLICEGMVTDVELADALSRSPNGIRLYLKALIDDGLVKRFDPKGAKSRYFPSNICTDEMLKLCHVKPKLMRNRTDKSIKIRNDYLSLINSGINTSQEIAKRRNATVAGVTTTLCRMRDDGLIYVSGKTKGTGIGRSMNIWEATNATQQTTEKENRTHPD